MKKKKEKFFGSKFERRFRIMGKLKKKGEHGHKAAYLTRRQAIAKLQVSFKMFRKLCILKGIAPRVPKIARASKRQTYYLAKDITYLSHEPLIETFRKYVFPLFFSIFFIIALKGYSHYFYCHLKLLHHPILVLHHSFPKFFFSTIFSLFFIIVELLSL